MLAGSRTEREIELAAELNQEKETRRQREIRLAELEDENHRLKSASAPAPARKSDPWTFMETATED